jgi:uncharacterized sulfatase
LLGLLLSSSGEGRASESAEPGETIVPNIVLLIGDDYGYPYYGFMGDEIVETPNLDRLAEEGVRFDYAHATSNVCRPSMFSFLTGLYPYQLQTLIEHRTGVSVQTGSAGRSQWQESGEIIEDLIRKDPDTLPRALSRAGYTSFEGGKFWEGTYRTAGFTKGMTTAKGPRRVERFGRHRAQSGAEGLALGRETMDPVFEFIEKNRERPFFIWYSPLLPHSPHDPPRRLLKRYEGRGLSKSSQRYFAMCTWFDEGVGELLKHLEKNGLREKTLIVYASDNGWEQEPSVEYSHSYGGPRGKLSFHEQAFRTPLLFHWPGHIEGGQARDELVSTADLYPTLLDFAGVASPPSRVGHSLRGRLAGEGFVRRTSLIGSTTFLRLEPDRFALAKVPWDRQRVFYVTTPQWHYVHVESRNEEILYDRKRDPKGEKNLIESNEALAEGFRSQIESWKAALRNALKASVWLNENSG